MIGSLIIAFGFYTVMWGQIKEKELAMDDGIDSLESASQRSPLVKSDSNEETWGWVVISHKQRICYKKKRS